MAAFNVFSPFSYSKLVDTVFELKKKYHNNERYWVSAIQLDTSYIRFPSFLSVRILEDEHKKLILESAKRSFYYAMPEFKNEYYGFSNTEIQKIKRLYDYTVGNDYLYDVEQNRIDFVSFVDEHDKRRGTNFLQTFPELENLYNNVKNR